MVATNLNQARHLMIQQQIKPWEVNNDRILNAISQLPRDEFVPDSYKNLAYADFKIPLSDGERMMSPTIEAKMLQALDPQSNETILEIGTGSGYITACLASLGLHVTSYETSATLMNKALTKLEAHNIKNIKLHHGDAFSSESNTQYHIIAVTGALPEIPQSLKNQLEIGGRLFVITGHPPIMEAMLIQRVNQDKYSEVSLFDTELDFLDYRAHPASFTF